MRCSKDHGGIGSVVRVDLWQGRICGEVQKDLGEVQKDLGEVQQISW